jgi:D-arabinose 1-dehydrogenase-like Zn-dependent alcohol dehydrogenase
MRAVCFDSFAGPLRVDTLPDPSPSAHGVVVRVHATGLCRSDWHGWQGHDPDIHAFPHVPGHELAGTVAAVGRDVRRWRVGDRVTVPFVCACGTCTPCARGDAQVCDAQTQPGFTHWGSYAEHVALHHADVNLVALPEAMSFDAAAGLGCRFATSFRAVVDQGRVQPGQWVAVFGCGGVGLSAIMIARALGARVIGVDVSEAACTLAQQAGAEVVFDARDAHTGAATPARSREVRDHVRELTGGGVDVSLDALGSRGTARGALEALRKNGRMVQVGLMAGDDANPPFPLHLLIARELELVGSHGMAAHAYPRMLDMVLDGRLNPLQLVTRRLTLDAAPEALATMVTAPVAGVTIIHP